MKIGVIGLGYVGLPLCLQFARSGVDVVGLDVDDRKIAALTAGTSYIEHIPAAAIQEQVNAGRFRATADFSTIKQLDAVII